MADHLGSYNTASSRTTVRFAFTTHAASGAAVAPSSAFENADLEIYKDGSATQRSSDSGVTMTSPFDSLTGLHHVSIDLTDNTDAGFWAAGSFYMVVLAPDETVDSLAVVKVLAYFEIGPPQVNVTQLLGTAWLAPGTAGTPDVNVKLWNGLTTVALPLVPTTAGRTLDVSAGGEAGVDWANVGSPTTSLALTGTTIATTQKVDIETIKTQSVTCAAGVTVLASVGTAATSTAQTGDSFARIGATGSGLTSLASQASLDVVDDLLDTEVAAILALLDTEIATLITQTGAAAIRTAVGLGAANLDTQLDALPTNAELATAITTGLTTALTEGHRGTGATGSVRDLLYEVIAHLGESSISSTTKTLKKLDASTTAKTYTLDSATTPTSITETT